MLRPAPPGAAVQRLRDLLSRWADHRLAFRLLGAILLASGALALIATAVQLYVDYRNDLLAIDGEFEQVERTYLDSLANSLWSFNDTQIRLQLAGLVQLPDLRYVELIGNGGAHFVAGEKPTGSVITRHFSLHYTGPGGSFLGDLAVTVALDGVYARLVDKALVILVTQMTKTFFISLFILFIVSRWVTRHLEVLARYARSLSLERLGRPIRLARQPGHAPDELDEVASALNEMSQALGVELRQRSLAENARRTSDERFRDYAETASDWFWESGEDHRLTYLSNRSAAFGSDPALRLGKLRWELATDRESEPEKWTVHLAALEQRKPFRDFVYRTYSDNGSVRFVSISGKPVFDRDGRFRGYRGSGREITEAVRAADALREAKQQAEIANRAKSEFLANMSHELRTPLNAIIGFAEMMKLGMVNSGKTERYQSYAGDIHASGTHLLDIINGILDVAQIEAGKFEFNERELRLVDVVAQIVRMMGAQASQAQLTLVTEIEAGLPQVLADERAMRQILINLVSNALKFTPPGGRITIRLAHEPASGVRLSVSDTGIGIAAEDQAKLMKPFIQVGNVYQRRYQGTGLGLALVRSLAELHGGAVTIESAPKQGTTVTVWLPERRVIAA
jgi:PAS domain S-box-containing protein